MATWKRVAIYYLSGDVRIARPHGLFAPEKILKDIGGIEFVYFSKTDVVRHRLVQDIIKAYEELEEQKQAREGRD